MTHGVRPRLLLPNNFTPPCRTPWGGDRLARRYKQGVDPSLRIGESWEISVVPELPSHVVEGDTLDAVVRADPAGFLGHAARRTPSAELLVKLIDAADDLSIQIHPDDDYGALAPNECGKPECWYVVESDEGSGLYVGLAEGVDEPTMRARIESGGDVSALLAFVPVESGDFFLIDAGTPHAIGRGVLVVEPQRVEPGRSGVTYRYWDWNRRYDANGRPHPDGAARALHVEHALAVTRWDLPRGEAALARIRHRAGAPDLHGPARIDALASAEGPVRAARFAVSRVAGTGTCPLPAAPFLRGLTVLDGTVTVESSGGRLEVVRGRSAVLPAALEDARIVLERAHAVVSGIA